MTPNTSWSTAPIAVWALVSSFVAVNPTDAPVTGEVRIAWRTPRAALGLPVTVSTVGTVLGATPHAVTPFVVVQWSVTLAPRESRTLSLAFRQSPDIDGNGVVDAADLSMLHGAFGPLPTQRAPTYPYPWTSWKPIPQPVWDAITAQAMARCDLNLDGEVDGADQAIILGEWTI